VVTVTDPWEFTDHDGSNVFVAQMRTPVRASRGVGVSIVLDLGVAIRALASDESRYFVVELDSAAYASLMNGHQVACNLTGVSADKAAADTAPDATDWRGRFPAARAQIKRSWRGPRDGPTIRHRLWLDRC
jgi:hypothetical protein